MTSYLNTVSGVARRKLLKLGCWFWKKKNGTIIDIITLFATQLNSLAYHIFSCNWNYAQFQHVRDNLKPGFLLQVYDFGQNFMNVYQDEPQAVHWDHTQTTTGWVQLIQTQLIQSSTLFKLFSKSLQLSYLFNVKLDS